MHHRTEIPEELMLYDSDDDSEVYDTDDEDSNGMYIPQLVSFHRRSLSIFVNQPRISTRMITQMVNRTRCRTGAKEAVSGSQMT